MLCQSAEFRHTHTDDHVWADRGHEFTLKLLIGQILQGEQALHNGSVHGTPSFSEDTISIVFFLPAGKRSSISKLEPHGEMR